MPIDIPESRKEVVDRSKTDVKNELIGSNPFLQNSFVGAVVTAFGGRVYDFYLVLRRTINELFPDTATGDFAERWGNLVGVNRLPATQSNGFITLRGSGPVAVPAGTALQSSAGLTFETQALVNVQNTVFDITNLTRVGQTATATTDGAHTLASGVSVTIAGANEVEYNGTFEIQVSSDTEFSYEIEGSPTFPATGTITAASIIGSAEVVSDGFGVDNNLEGGDSLVLTTPIAGIIDPAFVQVNGLTGGADLESDEDYRDRYVEVWQNPSPTFNVADIIQTARTVPGVTRIFVEEITPAVGQVTVYFLRDNDEDGPIPTPAEVQEVKDALLTIRPAHMNPDDIIVLAPVPVVVNFDFTALNPNTETMQPAITANLEQFFREEPQVGVNVTEDSYRCAILQTVDPATGDRVVSFTLSSPVGDIVVASNEIAILGTVTYP